MASTAVQEISRSGEVAERNHETVKTLMHVGVAGDTHTGVPQKGKTDTSGFATAPTQPVTDYICQEVRTIPKWQAGRVMYVSTFNKLEAP